MGDVSPATAVADLAPDRRRAMMLQTVARTTIAAIAVVVAYFVAPLPVESDDSVVFRFTVALVLTLGALVHQLRAIVVASVPQLRMVQAFGFVVPLVVVLFAALHVVLSRSDAGAYSEVLDHVGGLYFSLTTSTTVGFGDISAVSDSARIAVMVQIVVHVVAIGFAVRLAAAVVRARTGDGSSTDR